MFISRGGWTVDGMSIDSSGLVTGQRLDRIVEVGNMIVVEYVKGQDIYGTSVWTRTCDFESSAVAKAASHCGWRHMYVRRRAYCTIPVSMFTN